MAAHFPSNCRFAAAWHPARWFKSACTWSPGCALGWNKGSSIATSNPPTSCSPEVAWRPSSTTEWPTPHSPKTGSKTARRPRSWARAATWHPNKPSTRRASTSAPTSTRSASPCKKPPQPNFAPTNPPANHRCHRACPDSYAQCKSPIPAIAPPLMTRYSTSSQPSKWSLRGRRPKRGVGRSGGGLRGSESDGSNRSEHECCLERPELLRECSHLSSVKLPGEKFEHLVLSGFLKLGQGYVVRIHALDTTQSEYTAFPRYCREWKLGQIVRARTNDERKNEQAPAPALQQSRKLTFSNELRSQKMLTDE